jgi:hypothetical protein
MNWKWEISREPRADTSVCVNSSFKCRFPVSRIVLTELPMIIYENPINTQTRNGDSSVDVAARLRAGIRVPAGARTSLHSVQAGSGAHSTSYLMGTGDYFPRG